MTETIVSDRSDHDYNLLPESEELAKSVGSKYYYSGPCRNGHDSPRYTSIKRCVVCQATASKRLIDKDPDLAKAKLRDRYVANKVAIRERVKAWYQKTIEDRRVYSYDRYREKTEHIKSIRRAYLKANPDKSREYQRKSRKKRKDKILAYNKKYKSDNRHIYAEAQKARQTLQQIAMPTLGR